MGEDNGKGLAVMLFETEMDAVCLARIAHCQRRKPYEIVDVHLKNNDGKELKTELREQVGLKAKGKT